MTDEVRLAEFMAQLACKRKLITWQEYKTLAGQAKHGDIEAAAKGLNHIIRRLEKNGKRA